MNQQLIQAYLNELRDLRKASGTVRESTLREAFKGLLKTWGRSLNLVFVSEYEIASPAKERRYVDGALLHELRVPFGYWEAKDIKDDLDKQIALKFRRGYPQTNIIFEDSRTAVLFQSRQEVARCAVDDPAALERLLRLFFAYEPAEITQFRKAVAQFKADLPAVLAALRARIDRAETENATFGAALGTFLAHARATINPGVTAADVREMLIQHVLTEDIFARVFGEGDFHRQNNVARALYALEATFFVGGVKHDTLKALEPYYAAIRAAAAQVAGHREKQEFLKVIYENFYKVYNPKAADRLGVIYTPDAVVRFIIEGADWLCETYFGKRLIDKGVEILDPAAGTGTFVTELIEYFRGQPAKLRAKYREELHANEVAILPYYVANLNIEATYAAIAGGYEEFPNLCFVDTLDNLGWVAAQGARGTTADLFGAVSAENMARIRRQNARKISVVIGNPPYNANQRNENDNNKNRVYPAVDKRIKATYIAASRAQKTKLYDMYVRFFRWASDRIGDRGIVAFITNRSFLDAYNADGFRRVVPRDFTEAFIIDLGGDYKKTGVAGGGNVFGIGTGVAISFWVRGADDGKAACRVRYYPAQGVSAEEKLAWLGNSRASGLQWDEITPKDGYWIDHPERSFDNFLEIANKQTRQAQDRGRDRAIFRYYSLGVSTNRDEWLYDFSKTNLVSKVKELAKVYSGSLDRAEHWPDAIKWSRNLKRRARRQQNERFGKTRVREAFYRPFVVKFLYDSTLFVDERGGAGIFFPGHAANVAICFSDVASRSQYSVLAVNRVADLHFGAAVDAYQQVARYRFVNGERIDNITDWALAQFQAHYVGTREAVAISKDAIFHYVYGVLHDPGYRETYAENLKRSFPRIPFHADFSQWAEWGETLMRLHVGYESVDPWKLRRIDVPDTAARRAGVAPKVLLKSDPAARTILLDSETQLADVPVQAWTYHLGIRSAIDWVLDQHKERTPKDPTIRARFNTYRFADHKERVIDLLARVVRVSVETVAITQAMRSHAARHDSIGPL